jgi:hypothetical protein
MKTIKITSYGEIDIRAFSKMGASSKRQDGSKIGMFGSGLKYSLAFLLRNKIPFRVFSGYREVKFTTQEDTFRGATINNIYINDRETDLTTDMGMDWQHWFVVREIFCNALDESDGKIEIIDTDLEKTEPIEDYTTFYIQCDDKFNDILKNWQLYFSDKRKDCLYQNEDKNEKIYSGGDSILVYRKGIRCLYVENQKSMFSYDMGWIDINESRVVADEWNFKYNLCKFLKQIKDRSIINTILYNINEYWEKGFYWSSSFNFSEEWLDEIGDKTLVPYENAGFWDEEVKYLLKKHKAIILPHEMVNGLKLTFGDKIQVIGESVGGSSEIKVINELSKRQTGMLDEAVNFLKKLDYKVTYPIKVVKFSKSIQLGQAIDETILISEKVFDMGVREVVSTIIEENEHLKTGYSDETRAFQTHLINLLISSFEDKLGKYL